MGRRLFLPKMCRGPGAAGGSGAGKAKGGVRNYGSRRSGAMGEGLELGSLNARAWEKEGIFYSSRLLCARFDTLLPFYGAQS